MITALVYGRNDDYSYGLQKRGALSLNFYAELLEPGEDEILFVDYNTAEDLATFPEAISDTLTPRARALLRIIRVRPAFHERIAKPGDLPVLEAFARNIGLRRSDPTNRWVLSTNADILPMPAGDLRAAAAGLEDGYYGLPRFELPRFLWEQLDRMDVASSAALVEGWTRAYALDEAELHHMPEIGFDAPGHFQFTARRDLMRIGGFDERMRKAWHIDSNLAARLALIHGPARLLSANLSIYHCENTSAVRAKYAITREEDSFDDFVVNVRKPEWTSGAWGAPREDFETITLSSPQTPRGAAPTPPPVIASPETFGRTPERPEHTMPYVFDHIAHRCRSDRIAWVGPKGDLHRLVSDAMADHGFVQPLAYGADADAAAIILNAPYTNGVTAPEAIKGFQEIVAQETARLSAGLPPRPVIAVNAINGPFEEILFAYADVVLAPYTTRLRLCRVRPAADRFDWMAAMASGSAGRSIGDRFASTGAEGHVVFGPLQRILPGDYRLEIAVEAGGRAPTSPPVLECVVGERFLAQRSCDWASIRKGRIALDFTAPESLFDPTEAPLEIRLWVGEGTRLSLSGIVARRRAPHEAPLTNPHRKRISLLSQLGRWGGYADRAAMAARGAATTARPVMSASAPGSINASKAGSQISSPPV